MKNHISTNCLLPGAVEESDLTYVVMCARYKGDWIFVRHVERETWEMPAGHIEKGESADQAAVRELFEEAGVVRSNLAHICDYSVTVQNKTDYGRLYGAFVEEMDPRLEHEIAELLFSDQLPRNLTYPEVQTILFERAKRHF